MPKHERMHMVKALPAYLDGKVLLFNFAVDGIDHHSLEWFFVIQDELMQEWSENERNGCADKGFIHNQSIILEAFVKGNLYGLCMPETQSMYDNVTPDDPHFMNARRGAQYRFPVFCALDEVASQGRKGEHVIELLWVAPRMRRRGLGTRLVECLKKSKNTERRVTGAMFVEGAEQFWQTFGTVTSRPGPAQVWFDQKDTEAAEEAVKDEIKI
jgi:hypothetical protein